MAKGSRSIDRALEMTPEAETFIRGETSSAASVSRSGVAERRKTRESKPKPTTGDSVGASRQVERSSEPSSSLHLSSDEGFLVQITTRLRSETADAQRRACLEQKLARRKPKTQQDIIELALQAWLVDRGCIAG